MKFKTANEHNNAKKLVDFLARKREAMHNILIDCEDETSELNHHKDPLVKSIDDKYTQLNSLLSELS